jgi:hypothetical protein
MTISTMQGQVRQTAIFELSREITVIEIVQKHCSFDAWIAART